VLHLSPCAPGESHKNYQVFLASIHLKPHLYRVQPQQNQDNTPIHIFIGLTSQLKSTSMNFNPQQNPVETVANQPAPPALSRQLPLSLPPLVGSAKLVLAAPLRRERWGVHHG
jgi:hypothetical protein